jgi:Mg2+/Co2+ transporter CorB
MSLDSIPVEYLFITLFVLILCSAFFSGAETALMSVNRYRIHNKAKSGILWAKVLMKMLNNPSRMLSTILIGNNFVNILASSIATVLGIRYFGDSGILISTAIITAVVLIFAEVTPKTFAALYPAKLAFVATFVIAVLEKLLYPLVFIIDKITSFLFYVVGISKRNNADEQLSSQELRTVIMESSKFIPKQHRDTMIGFLELDEKSVEDVMTSIIDIKMSGIDLKADLEEVRKIMHSTKHAYLPVFEKDIENILGVVETILFKKNNFSFQDVRDNIIAATYTPMDASLLAQLEVFSKNATQVTVAVDEYGKVQGILTFRDIVDDVMKSFLPNSVIGRKSSGDGSIIVRGDALLRDINKKFDLGFPTDGPKTLSGLIIEELAVMPKNNLCLKIESYQIDTLKVCDNSISQVRIRNISCNK